MHYKMRLKSMVSELIVCAGLISVCCVFPENWLFIVAMTQ